MEQASIKQLVDYIKANMAVIGDVLEHVPDKDVFLLERTPIELLLLAKTIECHLNR